MEPSKHKTLKQFLTENPQLTSSHVGFQSDDDFPKMGRHLLDVMIVLGRGQRFTYLLNTDHGFFGSVFLNDEIDNAGKKDTVVPVMTVDMRVAPTPLAPLRQVGWVATRKLFGGFDCATNWYFHYAKYAGGIVCDHEHLKGGQFLWRSLIKNGEVSMVDLRHSNPILTPIDVQTKESDIWGDDADYRNILLVYKP